MILHDTLES